MLTSSTTTIPRATPRRIHLFRRTAACCANCCGSSIAVSAWTDVFTVASAERYGMEKEENASDGSADFAGCGAGSVSEADAASTGLPQAGQRTASSSIDAPQLLHFIVSFASFLHAAQANWLCAVPANHPLIRSMDCMNPFYYVTFCTICQYNPWNVYNSAISLSTKNGGKPLCPSNWFSTVWKTNFFLNRTCPLHCFCTC